MEKFITFLRRIDGIGFLLMLIGFFWCLFDYTSHHGHYAQAKFFLPILILGVFIFQFPRFFD